MELDDLVVNRGRGDGIQTRRRIVEQQETRLRRHRAGNRDATALTAGQFGRHPVDVFGEPDESQHFLDPVANLVLRRVRLFVDSVPDILVDSQRIEERGFLEQHADVRADLNQLALGHVVDAPIVDQNPARVRSEQPENQLQHDRFSGAAATEQDLHAPFRDNEAEIAEHDMVVERERHLVEHHRRRFRTVQARTDSIPFTPGERNTARL